MPLESTSQSRDGASGTTGICFEGGEQGGPSVARGLQADLKFHEACDGTEAAAASDQGKVE